MGQWHIVPLPSGVHAPNATSDGVNTGGVGSWTHGSVAASFAAWAQNGDNTFAVIVMGGQYVTVRHQFAAVPVLDSRVFSRT